jgi:DNA polymerase IV
MPDWVKEGKIYSCERVTPAETPNDEFIAQLKKIKLARVLTGDEIGVRAYSTSIASLAAYPYPLASAREILALPGCDQKIAQLFHEWHTSGGHIEAIAEIDADPILKVLHLFYEIWGVGASTAREFYYERHWRDLDDIIEHGWKSLTRVQQIGVKYYDEFQLKMSRSQVEAIAATIQSHARRLTDDRLESIIVGGYRRGKLENADADVILTHPSVPMTKNLISSVVAALEASGWITHTLTLALTNSNRDQQPLPLRTTSTPGHGFDTLDKALLVWQDPSWPSRAADLAADPAAKNPNPHRRVDIIISPWRTIGCAVEGWTSGTTFQRDLRRYAKKIKGWKFDSSGVRDRESGRWIDLEGWSDPATRCTDWRVAEKRVFEGFGLTYREPWERCTG